MVTKTHQPVSMPFGLFEEFDEALKGTRFDINGKRNRSAAICEFMKSMIYERKKSTMEEQIKNGEALERQSPTSDILQTNDEYINNQINKLMENKQEVTDAVISRQEHERQAKIYNYFAPICENIFDRSQTKTKQEQPVFKPRVATEQEIRLLKRFEKEPEHVVISTVKRLRQEVREGKVVIKVAAK